MKQKTKNPYLEQIQIPKKIPAHQESHYLALRKAKKVIAILCFATTPGKESEYSIRHGGGNSMTLPQEYNKDDMKIRFLPGWGTYEVTFTYGLKISLRVPNGVREFQSDLEKLSTFSKKYHRASSTNKLGVLTDFIAEMREANRMVTPTF